MGKYEAVRLLEAVQERQTARSVLMIAPRAFGFNPETAATNRFSSAATEPAIARRARREFMALADRLQIAGVDVHFLRDSSAPAKPDAVFPNNWVSFHADGTIVTYPMAVPSRRHERRPRALKALLRRAGFELRRHIDLSHHEDVGRCLEGTGSLVFDRPRRRAYACLGPRTHAEVVADFDARTGFSTFTFGATDHLGLPVYHTNVVMSLGSRYALVCLECVDEPDRRRLVEDLELGGRTVIEVSYDQMLRFACNILEIEDGQGRPLVAMSSGAFESLRADQVQALETLAGEMVHVPVPVIEAVGGGGVRCMIADVHLPRVEPVSFAPSGRGASGDA